MKPWLFAMFSGVRTRHTQTFVANATWTAPISTAQLESIVGIGTGGSPGTDAYDEPPVTKYRQFTIKNYTYARSDGGDPFVTNTVTRGATFDAPGEHITTVETASMTGTYSSVTVITNIDYEAISVPGVHHDAELPTTGLASSGFGKTFPGGVGGAAIAATYNNVPVTRGATYNLVIPAGGSITITWLQ
jgi:hypothetical protein